MRKRVYSFLFLFLILFSLASCDGNNKSTFDISSSVSEKFPFKYGKVYSDEFEKDDEFYFGDDLKKIIFGERVLFARYGVGFGIYCGEAYGPFSQGGDNGVFLPQSGSKNRYGNARHVRREFCVFHMRQIRRKYIEIRCFSCIVTKIFYKKNGGFFLPFFVV